MDTMSYNLVTLIVFAVALCPVAPPPTYWPRCKSCKKPLSNNFLTNKFVTFGKMSYLCSRIR